MDTNHFQEKVEQEGRKSRRERGRRRRRRRKGKGKGKGRRRHRGRKRERTVVEGGTEDGGERLRLQANNQYYEKIHLFGFLDTAHNATDSMT